MPKQSTQFYRKNEARIMKQLGLNPTKNSGAGWVEKGDGKNDYIIAELKSTEKKSISVKFEDLAKIEEHGLVANKIPIFCIQDLTNDEVFVMMKPENIVSVAKYLKTGVGEKAANINQERDIVVNNVRPKKTIEAPTREELDEMKYRRKENKAY